MPIMLFNDNYVFLMANVGFQRQLLGFQQQSWVFNGNCGFPIVIMDFH